MSNTHLEVRPGAYHDSVTLMRVSREAGRLAGVEAVLAVMATELNRELLTANGFTLPEGVGPNDLVIAVRARDAVAVDRATARVAELLDGHGGPGPDAAGEVAPATTGSAARRLDATLALVSVPGQHAFVEAMDALLAGLNVMVFSDNVPLRQEITLKEAAARRGLLVMGPDCGTAVVGGVGLGFANAVRRGPVGLVAASGTGAQQVMCLLDLAEVGVSHVLGVGSRDLTAEVGGRSTRQALAALDADPATELIVVVSKPPAPQVARDIERATRELATPVVLGLLEPRRDLTMVAEEALTALGRARPDWPSWPPPHPQRPRPGAALRGLFAGGTLCAEAMLIAAARLGGIRANVASRPDLMLGQDLRADGHLMIDFGDDALTRGRAHPMIDPTLRLARLAEEAADPACGVVLLDVVLGYGADPDPAATLAPAIRAARARATDDGRDLAVVVSLCGTSGDPQDLPRQAAALRGAGAAVFGSNAAAARHAATLVAPEGEVRVGARGVDGHPTHAPTPPEGRRP